MIGSLYSEERRWLHAVPAGGKLVAVMLATSALFLLPVAWPLFALALLCCLVLLSLGRVALGARRLLVATWVAGVLMVGFHVWLGQPMVGVASALRLVAASSLGAALTLTTSFHALLAVLERWLHPLHYLGLSPQRLALQLGMMLRFTEHFFVQWQRLDDAYRLRTGQRGGIRILGPLCIHMLQATQRVADALQARLGR